MKRDVFLIPVSTIIPTYNRPASIEKTLKTIAAQDFQFNEIVIIDASADDSTKERCQKIEGLSSKIVYRNAINKGAATQRNEGFSIAENPFIGFMDDDVYLEAGCIKEMWDCFTQNVEAGGVSAMITNQKYEPLGRFTRLMCYLVYGKTLKSFAGKCIGPAWNFLPDDSLSLPEYCTVEWLNLGLTIYKREVLPSPPFQNHFVGYSMMEDLTLSLTVGKKCKLFNARNAKIFHDSQPGDYKKNVISLQKMELINRHFVMTSILKRNSLNDYLKLFLLEVFFIASLFRTAKGIRIFPKTIIGKIQALTFMLTQRFKSSFAARTK